MQGKQIRYNVKLKFLVILGCLFIVIVTPLTVLNAQTSGTITGRIIDVDSKEYLPGANIILQGTTFGTASDRGGLFRISNVPPGTYNLVVSYIGYQDQTVEVTLLDDGYTFYEEIEIKPSDVKMQEVLIVGLTQGQVNALNQQKMSNNIKNVVSEEQTEKFPDINSAEVLQRISGISITRDQGEGRYVQVRGTAAWMNAMKVNGVDIPSPEGGERTTQMDIIPASQLASIEVIKALTPDIDANSIGGTVNLITRSALDYEKPVFNITVGGGYADISKGGIYQGALNYGTRFGANKDFGFMFGASYLKSDRGSDNNEMEWGNVDDILEENEFPWALENLALRNYDIIRDRLGFSTNLDYKPDIDNSYSIKAIYDNYLDKEVRNELTVEPGGFNTATDVIETEFVHEMKARDQEATIVSIMGTGENHFGGLTLDYSLSYNYAQEKEDRHYEPKFEMDETPDMTWNLSDPNNPKFTITSLDPDYY
ncbi:MAG: carboxypeptidase-like regulatory domain-containing protein, partial [Ignavibacteriaceae bacterium]